MQFFSELGVGDSLVVAVVAGQEESSSKRAARRIWSSRCWAAWRWARALA
jgi:hypothetical protein